MINQLFQAFESFLEEEIDQEDLQALKDVGQHFKNALKPATHPINTSRSTQQKTTQKNNQQEQHQQEPMVEKRYEVPLTQEAPLTQEVQQAPETVVNRLKSNTITSDKLQEGIVLAEILGPPIGRTRNRKTRGPRIKRY